jgi:transposase
MLGWGVNRMAILRRFVVKGDHYPGPRSLNMPILSLPNFTILNTQETDHDIMVNMEYTEHPVSCEKCRSKTATLKCHDAREHWFFDFPIRGKRTKLCVQHRRFKCSDCGAVFFQRLTGIDDKRDMTNRMVAWIGPKSLAVSFSMMAHSLGCADVTVRNIFMEHAERKAKELKSETPRVVGIDEICLGKKKRDKYRCVITDIEKRTMVDFLSDRDKKTVIKYFSTLDAEAVEIVCCDMWPSYRDAARIAFPKAPVVIASTSSGWFKTPWKPSGRLYASQLPARNGRCLRTTVSCS